MCFLFLFGPFGWLISFGLWALASLRADCPLLTTPLMCALYRNLCVNPTGRYGGGYPRVSKSTSALSNPGEPGKKSASSPEQEDQAGQYWHGSRCNRHTAAQFVSNRAHEKREEIADEPMITGKKVLEVRYRDQNNQEGLVYAEEKQIGSEAITL